MGRIANPPFNWACSDYKSFRISWIVHRPAATINAPWKSSKEDFEAMLRNPEASKHRGVAESIASADPRLYKAESVHHV